MPCVFFFSPARCHALTTRPGALKKYPTVHCLQKGGGGISVGGAMVVLYGNNNMMMKKS